MKIFRKILCGLLALAAVLGCAAAANPQAVRAEGEETFFINPSQGGISTFSLDNSSNLNVNNERYDKFCWDKTNPGDSSCPQLGTGLKYIVGDDLNPDGRGNWRYVYCLEFEKSSPWGQLMSFVGFTNRKISYALYYGAVYYGQPCRYAGYSTGDWQMDYFVTQMAIHILNDEFTLGALRKSLDHPGSAATDGEKELAYDRIRKMVNDANDQGNYGGYTSDGWIDMGQGTFSVTGYQDSWSKSGESYVSGGAFQANFQSYYGYDYREQIADYQIEVPQQVTVSKSDEKTYSDFRLQISREQFENWQLTGKTIPVKVTMKIPRYWGGGIYRHGNGIQDVCFLTWSHSGGDAVYSDSAQLHIPKVTRDLTIRKQDADDGKALPGAVFSLWAYDGNSYGKKLKNFTDNGDGTYTCKEIDYTQTVDGWFLVKEERAPDGYDKRYVPGNSTDQSDYEAYGGRQLHMTAAGLTFDGVPEGTVFKDEKLVPQARLEVKKYDAADGRILENAEISVFEWSQASGTYKEKPLQLLTYDRASQRYVTGEALTRTEENQGKFLIKETQMPEGYRCPFSREIQISKPGLTTVSVDAPNYPVRTVSITKRIRAADVNWAHGNPTFFFKISGKDVNGEEHTYRCFVELTAQDQSGEYLEKTTAVSGIPAGSYQVEEEGEVLRYILADAQALTENAKVKKENLEKINGVQKIAASFSCDLTLADAAVRFFNEKVMHDRYTDNQVLANHISLK